MRTIGLTALTAFGLATPALADGIVPETYQGVWASGRDCTQNFQNVLATVVNREQAACRVTQAQGSGPPESGTSTIILNCGGSWRREIWRAETIEGEDTLVIVQLQRGGEPSIDIYKRCSEIPLGEIRLSDIPGNPAAETVSDDKTSPPPRLAHSARRRPASHSRANRPRRRSPQ